MRLIYLSGLFLLAPIQSAVAEISWYLGGGGAITKIETTDFVGISGVGTGLPPNTTVTTGDFSDSPLGWQLFVGVMFSENFGFFGQVQRFRQRQGPVDGHVHVSTARSAAAESDRHKFIVRW